jgi:hypothetical protein
VTAASAPRLAGGTVALALVCGTGGRHAGLAGFSTMSPAGPAKISPDTSVSGPAGGSRAQKKGRSPHVGEALGNQTSEHLTPAPRFAANGSQPPSETVAKVFDFEPRPTITGTHSASSVLPRTGAPRRVARALNCPISVKPRRVAPGWPCTYGSARAQKTPGNSARNPGKLSQKPRETQPETPGNSARNPGATAGGAR